MFTMREGLLFIYLYNRTYSDLRCYGYVYYHKKVLRIFNDFKEKFLSECESRNKIVFLKDITMLVY